MKRVVMRLTLLGLLLAVVTAAPSKEKWDIYSFHINSTVTSRYATTVITSRVVNRVDQPTEIEFHVRIPKNAFISKFRMLIDGQMYDGVVKAKEQAQRQYTDAVARGGSAGLISSVGRTLEEFKTSVTVAALQKVTFELTYEELLKRRLGKYELQIHARPMQPIKDFKIDIHINEKAGINFMEVKGALSTKALANAITQTTVHKQAWVYFYPTEEQQTLCDSCGKEGMNGDLVIVYDVNRENSLGDIKESDGYFLHHFAPASLPRIPKNVVFLIDRSGSMHGKKMQQTRAALLQILGDLAEDDFFGLITFDSRISPWKRELLQATQDNLAAAKHFAQHIIDAGATDINAAVLEGARMLNQHPREGSASLLILLTDGDPTSGETNLGKIHSNVREAIGKKFPLYCLGFGFDVNFEFLEKMSLENNGVARRIYQDSDAELQLKGFYEEVATPLLTDVMMIYVGGTNLTQTNFSQYYNGSEIVVAGQITDNNIETFIPQVVAISKNKKVEFVDKNSTVENVSESHIERVWAYLTVKQLLEKQLQLAGDEKQKVNNEALALSLKYGFVTPLTSMVVTKPPGENLQVIHKPKEGENPQRTGNAQAQPQIPFPQSNTQSRGFLNSHAFDSQADLHRRTYSKQKMLKGRNRKYPPQHSSRSSLGRGGGVTLLSSVQVDAADTQLWGAGIAAGAGAGIAAGAGAGIAPGAGPRDGAGARRATDHYDDDYSYDSYIYESPRTHNVAKTHSSVFHLLMDVSATQLPMVAATQSPAPKSHIFLLSAENQSVPLCYYIAGPLLLNLLQDPIKEISVNGKLDSVNHAGFEKIVIRYKTGLHIVIDTTGMTVQDGLNGTHSYWGGDLTIDGSMTVILRDKELDVSGGDTRMIVLLHHERGTKFLWPVLRQFSSGNSTTGLLALKLNYEVTQATPSTKLKIKDQEIDVTRALVMDYSVRSAPVRVCWRTSLESALQRVLPDFTVTQL